MADSDADSLDSAVKSERVTYKGEVGEVDTILMMSPSSGRDGFLSTKEATVAAPVTVVLTLLAECSDAVIESCGILSWEEVLFLPYNSNIHLMDVILSNST